MESIIDHGVCWAVVTFGPEIPEAGGIYFEESD